MDDTPQPNSQPDEIGLLDILVTLAENVKLLLVCPALVGLLTFGAAWFWPATYESSFAVKAQKTIVVDGVEVKLIQPPQVNSIVLAKPTLEAAAKTLTEPDLARRLLAGAATSNSPRNSDTVNVTLRGPTPQAAQRMAQALLAAMLQASRPQGDELARLQQDLKKDEDALSNARLLEGRMSQRIQQGSSTDMALAQNYAVLLPTIVNLAERAERHRIRLAGLTEADIVTRPSLTEKAVAPKKALTAIMATLGTGFLLIIWVFIRSGLRNLQDPESLAKLGRVKRALGLSAP